MYVWRRHGSSYVVWKLFEIVAPGGVYYAIYGPVYIRSVFSTIPDSSSNPDFFLDFIIFSTEFLLFSLCKAICFLLFRGNTMVWQQFTNFWVVRSFDSAYLCISMELDRPMLPYGYYTQKYLLKLINTWFGFEFPENNFQGFWIQKSTISVQ